MRPHRRQIIAIKQPVELLAIERQDITIKMFRPFPAEEFIKLCGNAKKIGVLDRNYSAGTGGIFWQEVRACMQGQGERVVQGYLTGVGGGDVVPQTVREVVEDLSQREVAGDPVWKGIDQ